MVDPWQKLGGSVDALRIAFGQALLPVLNPIVDTMAAGVRTILQWSNEFPNITRWVGVGAVTVLGLVASFAALTVAVGVAKLAWAGLLMVKSVVSLFSILIPSLKTLRAVMLGVNLVMYANPVGLIVAGVAALIGAVGAAIYYWEDLKASFIDMVWSSSLVEMISGVMDWFKSLGGLVGSVMDFVISGLNKIPGINIDSGSSDLDVATPTLDAPRQSAVPSGGVSKQLSQAFNNNSSQSRSVNIGQIVTSQPAVSVEQEFLMGGG